MMKNQILIVVGLATALSLAASTQSFAGQWHSDTNGWWWQNDDGTYPVNTWQWIDKSNDGSSECYYFNPEGYCVIGGITPDGYTVDETGAWIVNGIVQIQQNKATLPSNSSKLAEAQKLLSKISYYGKTNRCTMTAEQARAYIQLLKDGAAEEMPIPPGYSKVLEQTVYWDCPFINYDVVTQGRKRRLGSMKGQKLIADGHDIDECNDEIAGLFEMVPDENFACTGKIRRNEVYDT